MEQYSTSMYNVWKQLSDSLHMFLQFTAVVFLKYFFYKTDKSILHDNKTKQLFGLYMSNFFRSSLNKVYEN